jgi:hypothetical protein
MYRALKNLTNGGELIPADTEDLTPEQLGDAETIERLERLGAIEKVGKKGRQLGAGEEVSDAAKAEEKTGGKTAGTKEK